MGELNGASSFEDYLLAQSILTDVRRGAGLSQVAIADGATPLGRALVELGAHARVQVIAGVSEAGEAESLAALGAGSVIRCDDTNFVDQVMELTDGLGVDLVVDQVAGQEFDRNFDMLADFGDIVVTGWTHGDPPKLFETMWAKLDRCPCIQFWTLDRYISQPDRTQELHREVRDYLGARLPSQSETGA